MKIIPQHFVYLFLASYCATFCHAGYLGIDYKEVKGKIILTEIYRGSPAESVGLKVGDAVVIFNGEEINDPDAVINAIRRAPAGTSCNFGVFRGNESLNFSAILWEKRGAPWASPADIKITSKEVKLNQSGLSSVSLNKINVQGARPEISSFSGASTAILDEASDLVIFANETGKIERYSISTGHKMWTAQLPGGISVEGLHLGSNGSDHLYVIIASANEVVHQSSIWSLPLNGIGTAKELGKFWEAGSESGDVGAGSIVAGHFVGSDDFLITYQAGDGFGPDKNLFDAIRTVHGKIYNRQVYQVIFNAKNRSIRKLVREKISDLDQPTSNDSLKVFSSASSNFNLNNGEKGEVYLFNKKAPAKSLRKWASPSAKIEQLNDDTALINWLDNKQEILDTNNLIEALTQQPIAWKDKTNIKTDLSSDKGHTFSLHNTALHLDLEAGYAGGDLKLINPKTGSPIEIKGASELIDVTYGTKPTACWLNPDKALIGFSSGYYLLEQTGSEWNLRKINHFMLPIPENIVALKDNNVMISSQDGLYFASISENNITMEKVIVFGGRRASFILLKENYYSGAPTFLDRLSFADSIRTYPFEQFDLRLNRPDIVLERLGAPDEAIAIAKQLREKRLKRMGVTEEMLQPDFHLPEIEILGDLPSSTAENELALNIKASDSKYPLDRLRLYVNNVPVNGKEGELLRDAKSQTLERMIPIKLAAGRNKIQVSILNSAGAESLYANAEVQCTAPRPKPTLYAVAMGVSEYANPEWNLKYAAKDATDILARIHSQSGSSYGEVKELLLTDREVTKENLAKIREFLSKATVDDTVLMFVAGHGLLDSKYDYYYGTSDIDFENPSGKGIAFEEFDDLLAELPCLKKSLLIDTCHAGELDEDEKKALAAAQSAPTGQQVAMHPVGARGMSVKPIEGARGKSEWYDRLQGLFVDLRRGSGSTILSSSAGAEYALESSEQKNGLFTYAVLEALDGKEGSDANKDGSVTMSELAEYVKSRVATLTNNKQSPNVRRVNLEADFALSKK